MLPTGHIEWCNANEGRAYPLREEATRRADSGAQLPDDILADACLIVPPDCGDAFCSMVRVTPSLLAVSFSCANGPLAAGAWPRSAYSPYSAVPLTPLADNVSGWVVFGNHICQAPEHYIFSAPAQSALECRALRLVDRPPIPAFLKLGGPSDIRLSGVVRLVPGAGLRIYRGAPASVVFALDSVRAPAFLGPCEQYGDADQCGSPPIRRFNGVSPDADGQLTIRIVPHDWEEP